MSSGSPSDPLPARPLLGRVAIVTGGSRGIGLAIVQALAGAGAQVVLVARTPSELAAAAATLAQAGATVRTFCGDVSDRQFCLDVVTAAEGDLGSVDVLVNNAAVQGPIGFLEDLSPEEFCYTLRVDLLGPVWLMQGVIPGMKRRRRGSIINVSGGGAAGPRERFAAYAAAKAGLVRLTESVAYELRPFGVRCNAVAPGATLTRMLDEIEAAGGRAGEAALAEVRRHRKTGGVDPAVAAELVTFLASDAAAEITGRFLSAVWDDWRALRDRSAELPDPDWFTLRRVTPPPGSL